MALRTLAVGTILAAAVAGCGSSGSGGSGSGSTPDVTGAPASNQATLFKAANLQRVLTQVNTHLKSGASLTTVKIEPRDVKVVASGQIVTVDNKGRALTVVTPALPASGAPMTLSAITPSVVEQLAAKAASAAHKSLQDVAYVALIPDPISNKPSLGVYMTDLSYYTASLDGSGFKAHGSGTGAASTTPASATPATAVPSAAGAAAGAGAGAASSSRASGGGTVIDPQKIATCVQNAGGDAAKIQACTSH